jgi:hypothetical protein
MQTQADRQRLALVVAAVASVGLAALSLRTLNAASLTAARQVPAADLHSLSAYLAPLPDTASLAVQAFGSMVGDSDPFGAPAPASRFTPKNSDSASESPKPQWVVSSILFEGSKRSAIVNDAWVSLGEVLAGGGRVAAIERKYVIVTDSKGERQVIPLQGGRNED